jgi:hypothetical protein
LKIHYHAYYEKSKGITPRPTLNSKRLFHCPRGPLSLSYNMKKPIATPMKDPAVKTVLAEAAPVEVSTSEEEVAEGESAPSPEAAAVGAFVLPSFSAEAEATLVLYAEPTTVEDSVMVCSIGATTWLSVGATVTTLLMSEIEDGDSVSSLPDPVLVAEEDEDADDVELEPP